MDISRRVRKALRGDVSLHKLPLEAIRLKKAADKRKQERLELEQLTNAPARLSAEFQTTEPTELLTYFRQRNTPCFWSDTDKLSKLQTKLFPNETEQLIKQATKIVAEKKWSLLGFDEFSFDGENIWRRDPLTGKKCKLEYHHDIQFHQGDGSDIRVLWELNRFGHAISLARAYAVTNDEKFATEFFSQLESWQELNPYGRGVNWHCAMEVALRTINLLAVFDIFRKSPKLTADRLTDILQLFDQHGRFIFYNNEFSHISTSNHYLSDVVGLLWLGVLLPELQQATEWKAFGFREMLREMDKQVLSDGADFESSTGYHRFVTELFLYSFLLCKKNGLDIPEKYWDKLRLMFEFMRGYLRPDCYAPLIGDADGGQIIPIVKRDADDHAYLLSIGAVLFDESGFKVTDEIPQELLWLTDEEGFNTYKAIEKSSVNLSSCAFPKAGTYIMRDDDLYLHFNANDCGLKGRGSHAHNDALSVEISAFGVPFIVDPGTYVYNSDLNERQLFRSTSYHSTVQVDEKEQNTTDINSPFVIGNEARPEVTSWVTSDVRDFVSAKHYGYNRLKEKVVHRRSVEFNKTEKYWLIEDKLSGEGKHDLRFSFHLAPSLKVQEIKNGMLRIYDNQNRNLFIRPFGLKAPPETEKTWVSRNYGRRESSQSIVWETTAELPFFAHFLIVPKLMNADEEMNLDFIQRILNNINNWHLILL